MENKNTLAKVALGINVVLIILVVILFTKVGKSDVTSSNSNLNTSNGSDSIELNDTPTASTGKIAFFNMDSLSANTLLYAEIEKEMQSATAAAEQKMRNKQRDIDKWKTKWEKKGKLLSSEEAQYMKEAEKIQTEAMQFEQNVQIKLQQEQEEYMKTLALRISNYTSDFAKANGYDALFAYQFGQSPWYYNSTLDVTKSLVQEMNAEFKATTAGVNAE